MSNSAIRVLNDPGKTCNRNNSVGIISAFESLPLEILEIIFFYSLNVNLPRAIPSLAAFFSNERVYRLFILLAFWDNDLDYDEDYDSSEGKDVFGGDPARFGDLGTYTWRQNRTFDIPWILRPLGRGYVRLTTDERRMLQSGVLTCRWCTNERIREQFPDLGRLIIARWCINTGYIFEDDRVTRLLEGLLHCGEQGRMFDGVALRVNKKCPEGRGQGEEKDEYPRCRIILAVGEFVKFKIEGPEKEDDSSILSELDQSPNVMKIGLWFPVLSILAIPAHLFRPDVRWARDGFLIENVSVARMDFLNTLRLSGQLIPHVAKDDPLEVTYSRDALQRGIRAALSTLNIRALDLLLRLDLYFCRAMRPYYTIPPECFVFAAKLYTKAVELRKKCSDFTEQSSIKMKEELALLSFHFLLVSSAESLPYDNPAVRQVAISASGIYGKWLWDLMEILPQHVDQLKKKENCEYDTMFYSRGFNYEINAEMEDTYVEDVFAERNYLSLPEDWLTDDLNPPGIYYWDYPY